ncbi:MAG: hypothetical protein HY929_03320 [Euryarchaeota archaeon]|nr:hypothetical protein [Euryarchaeota archaeon]
MMSRKPLCFKEYSKQWSLNPELCELCSVLDECEEAEMNEKKKQFLTARGKLLGTLIASFGVLTLLGYYAVAASLGGFVIAYCYIMYKVGSHVKWETSDIKLKRTL